MSSSLSSTQIGKVGETIVGAQLMLASAGRLSPFLPIADDGGIDLVVHDKVTGRSLTIQVKGRVAKEEDTLGYTQFDVRTDLPPKEWTPGYAACSSACSGVL